MSLAKRIVRRAGSTLRAAAEGYLADPVARNMDVGSQAGFLCDPQGNVAVDRLFRYERIDQFLEFLEDRLNCEIILPRLNVSPAGQTDLPANVVERLRSGSSVTIPYTTRWTERAPNQTAAGAQVTTPGT
jgi:hypothetical protein